MTTIIPHKIVLFINNLSNTSAINIHNLENIVVAIDKLDLIRKTKGENTFICILESNIQEYVI